MIKELSSLNIFKSIDKEYLTDFINNNQIVKRSFYKGMTVHEHGSRCLGIDIVLSGGLVAYSLASNGSETIVFEFKKDSVIGANLLFGDENKYPMNIYCTEDCVLFHIHKDAVTELMKDYTFVMPFVRSLSLNSQGINERIAMYTQKSLRKNLMDYLIDMSEKQNSHVIRLPISKKQLADYFGVQRPSLFRELKRMKDEDLIEIDNKTITLNFL
ncbi:MAG: Crp/Fnr family transcriptional regulator [Firmicutes bacterium]|nr:Crp/Fnr family transcriptional regulator [Bacillota bacterium]